MDAKAKIILPFILLFIFKLLFLSVEIIPKTKHAEDVRVKAIEIGFMLYTVASLIIDCPKVQKVAASNDRKMPASLFSVLSPFEKRNTPNIIKNELIK